MHYRSLDQTLEELITADRLKALLLLAIVAPPVFFIALAWQDYRRTHQHAMDKLHRIAELVYQHATKTFWTADFVLERAAHAIGDRSPATLVKDEERIHAMLLYLTAQHEHIRNVVIWDEQGRPVASSRYHPVPRNVSVADRPFFAKHKNERARESCNGVMDGRLGGEPVFNISATRSHVEAGFLGVISVSFSPSYFSAFYRSIVDDPRSAEIALLREDGTVVAHFPQSTTGTAGQHEITVSRKIPKHPLYVTVSRARSSIVAEWSRNLVTAVTLCVPFWLLLTVLAWFSWRQTQCADRARLTAREEAVKRSEVEEELRELDRCRAMGYLTSGLAHDFNNLLQIVSVTCGLLRAMVSEADKARHLNAIDRVVYSARCLVANVLRFARTQTLALERVRLADALPDICNLARHALPNTIDIHSTIPVAVWDIAIDRSELELAIVNLVVNSRDAMPHGGTITVGARNVPMASDERIRAGVPASDFVALSVSDTGPGIPEQLLPRIFDRFFTTKGSNRGTGLGLSRVYTYARQLGGTAVAANGPTGGAVITLFIPTAKSRDDQAAVGQYDSISATADRQDRSLAIDRQR